MNVRGSWKDLIEILHHCAQNSAYILQNRHMHGIVDKYYPRWSFFTIRECVLRSRCTKIKP